MRKIIAKASFGFAGAEYEEEFEFPNSYTDEEIEQEISEWANQFVCLDWEEEEGDEEDE